jgi:two-component system phosphate regulon sensor histidine kinase PhoR
MRSRFVGKLFASYALLVVANALFAEFFASNFVARVERDQLDDTLAGQAALLAEAVRGALPNGEPTLEARVAELDHATGSRLTVVAPDGRVLADSVERPESMENHLERAEFVAAARAGRGVAERESKTTGKFTRYVCVAVRGDAGLLGFVRAALPLPSVEQRLAPIRNTVVAGVAVGTLLALGVATFVAWRVTQPIRAVTAAATRLAEGESVTIDASSGDEIGDLARAFNRMSARLRERFDEVERERAKLATVFESMAEGVVAVDADERLLHCNAAARAMLGAAAAGGLGRPLVELVRAPELLATLRRAREPDAPATVTQELRVHASGRERVLSIHAARLVDGGAVAVLLDVSELRRLETVRRDFVANVSHEIKTPLAAMRGVVETLLDDASMAADVRQRFLAKLGDQVQRLTDLATDLLHLARAESERTAARVVVDLAAAAASSCERFASAAAQKGVALRVEPAASDAAAPVATRADPDALAQVFDNLVDNALKYTPSGGSVVVRTATRGEQALVEVADTGIGIEPSEQQRVFERFYRVDKARSRGVPGTGLGLSIVKHLVEAHGGVVELESWPGTGSTFRVVLPRVVRAAGAVGTSEESV